MAEWTSQVRRGILEYCVLLLISERPTYGYELVTILNRWDPLTITEGTLYPILRRLVSDKHLESFWQESESGPPRKYYSLTAGGKQLLAKMSSDWNKIKESVNQIEQFRGEERP